MPTGVFFLFCFLVTEVEALIKKRRDVNKRLLNRRRTTVSREYGIRISAICLALGVVTGSVGAAEIELSLFSSDETPAEWLGALLDFTVSGNELTLTVSNNTDDPPAAFEMSEIGFNATDEVTGLSLATGLDDWTLLFDQSPGAAHKMDGFGRFDARLLWGGNQTPTILPGEQAVFTFDIEGAGFSDLSFVTDFSTPDPLSMIVAGKFIRGPDDDSAFGATPEPGALILLACGSMAAMRRRRR